MIVFPTKCGVVPYLSKETALGRGFAGPWFVRLSAVSSPGSGNYKVDQRVWNRNLGSEVKQFVQFSWSVISNIMLSDSLNC